MNGQKAKVLHRVEAEVQVIDVESFVQTSHRVAVGECVARHVVDNSSLLRHGKTCIFRPNIEWEMKAVH